MVSEHCFLALAHQGLAIQDQQSVYVDAVTLVMLCSNRCALPSSTRALRCLKTAGRPVKSLHAGGPGRQTACAHLSKYKTAGHNVNSAPERRLHVCAAFPACTGQGVSLLFSASTAYCVPLFAMVCHYQLAVVVKQSMCQHDQPSLNATVYTADAVLTQ